MRTIAIPLAAILLSGTAGLASADEHHDRTGPAVVSVDEMTSRIAALGYDVRRIKVDDGRYHARIVDRQTGGVVKAAFSTATGELLRAKLGS